MYWNGSGQQAQNLTKGEQHCKLESCTDENKQVHPCSAASKFSYRSASTNFILKTGKIKLVFLISETNFYFEKRGFHHSLLTIM